MVTLRSLGWFVQLVDGKRLERPILTMVLHCRFATPPVFRIRGMERVYLDRVAIWLPLGVEGLSTRISPPGRTYYKNDVVNIANSEMYRYAKNYQVGKGKSKLSFSLFMMTLESDAEAVEKYLDSIAKKATIEQVKSALSASDWSSFKWTDFCFKEDK